MINRPPATPQRPSAPGRPATGSLTPPPPSGSTAAPTGRPKFIPPPLNKVEDTGLNPLWLQDLCIKVLYFRGYLSGIQMAEYIRLPFVGIVDNLLNTLKREKLVEVLTSTSGFGEGAYQYTITGAGNIRARESLERSQYAGPAPVPIAAYNQAIRAQ
ncbi:MAG: hypothetical protein AAB427_13640, partial [Chloroflexota bacterium]